MAKSRKIATVHERRKLALAHNVKKMVFVVIERRIEISNLEKRKISFVHIGGG